MRFFLFSYATYYPRGGAFDLQGGFDSLRDAEAALGTSGDDWDNNAHLLDVTTGCIVARWSKSDEDYEWKEVGHTSLPWPKNVDYPWDDD